MLHILKNGILPLILLFSLTTLYCGSKEKQEKTTMADSITSNKNADTVTFGAGCFWCVEAIFQRVDGVVSVTSGYSGGSVANPSYEDVCTGTTGHAEACQIVFDSTKISFSSLLEIFWNTHDPTTLNRQGADAGTQYRSAIFYHSESQKDIAAAYKEQLQKSGIFKSDIVTEITPFKNFYKAEDYHQNYFNDNSRKPYCSFVIRPKVEKFEKYFSEKLKKGS